MGGMHRNVYSSVHYNASNSYYCLALRFCKVTLVNGQIVFYLGVRSIFMFTFVWEARRIENSLFFEWVLSFHALFDYGHIWNGPRWTEVQQIVSCIEIK